MIKLHKLYSVKITHQNNNECLSHMQDRHVVSKHSAINTQCVPQQQSSHVVHKILNAKIK